MWVEAVFSIFCPPASYAEGTGFLSPGVKLPGRVFNHAKVKDKVEIYAYTLSVPFVVCYGMKFTCI